MTTKERIYPGTIIRRELTKGGFEIWGSALVQNLVSRHNIVIWPRVAQYCNDRALLAELVKKEEELRNMDKDAAAHLNCGEDAQGAYIQKLRKDIDARIRRTEKVFGLDNLDNIGPPNPGDADDDELDDDKDNPYV